MYVFSVKGPLTITLFDYLPIVGVLFFHALYHILCIYRAKENALDSMLCIVATL